nr:MAG TPA: hypothetical protein [Caudoviricetes sp.]
MGQGEQSGRIQGFGQSGDGRRHAGHSVRKPRRAQRSGRVHGVASYEGSRVHDRDHFRHRFRQRRLCDTVFGFDGPSGLFRESCRRARELFQQGRGIL